MKKAETLNRRNGVVIWYAIVLMAAMCMILSLAVDYGRAQIVKTELMRAADSAARAAAAEVPVDPTKARALAVQYAAMNTADGSTVKLAGGDIVLGTWDLKQKAFKALPSNQLDQANAVQVTARRSVGTGDAVPLLFARILG